MSSALAGGADTIVARATPAGRSALAVIRISGPAVAELAARLCPGLVFERSWRAQLVEVGGSDGSVLERAVVIPYRAPRSYTGEDMLELVAHGSPALAAEIVEACVRSGCRPAQPGEFTRRAVANGKMDLVQAEGVRDMIRADTARQLAAARQQVAGVLSEALGRLRRELVGALAMAEAALDFPGQEVELDSRVLRARIERIELGLAELLRTAEAGRRIRDGFRVAIVGPVNAGKSTLFNALVGTDRAIVSPRPGTTRDLIEAEVELAGMRVVLVDTAGLREEADPVESEGVVRARHAAAEADLLIVVHPADGPADAAGAPHHGGWLGVLSKCDLRERQPPWPGRWLRTAARTGAGIEDLRSALGELVSAEWRGLDSGVAIGERHRIGLERAAGDLRDLDVDHLELAAERLRWAAASLAEVIGEVATEDVLDEVFRTFCLGK